MGNAERLQNGLAWYEIEGANMTLALHLLASKLLSLIALIAPPKENFKTSLCCETAIAQWLKL